MMPRLDVMICTCGGNGLEKVEKMHLPSVDGVRYIVSCQSECRELPAGLQRDDILVRFNDSKGLSNNRNFALSLATAPYALVADDDLVFKAEGLADIIHIFDSHPDVDIAAFRCEYPFDKTYPPGEHDLADNYRNYYLTSFEIAVRMEAVRRCSLRFSPLMGIGAPVLTCGEENVFVLSALKQGLNGRFFPVTIAVHPDVPTGERETATPGVLRAQGAYIWLAFGITVVARMMLKAWRTPGCFLRNLMYISQGVVYGMRHGKQLLHP